MKLGVDIGIRQSTAKSPVMDTAANIIGKALTMTPIMSGINADGTWGYGINGTNPIAMVRNGCVTNSTAPEYTARTTLSIDPFDGFNIFGAYTWKRADGDRPARPQGDRPYRNNNGEGGYNNRNNGDRPARQGDNRGQRPNGGNQRPFNNGRPGQGFNQGDRSGGRNNNFRGRDNGGRLDREIDKFNKDSAPLAEEMRGKETRERERDNKNRNGKQRGDYDVLGSRKQERFVNLEKKYLVSLSKQILVQENDYVRAGTPLSDGAITPTDILNIEGPIKVQEYIVNEVQDVYRMQGVKINDKHFEIIVHQMMRKVLIQDAGDTRFLENQVVDKSEFMEENDAIYGKKVVLEAGDSDRVKPGQIISVRMLRDINSQLKRRDLKVVEARDAVPATSAQVLQGITRAALQTASFISAASFQETTKVLNEAAIYGKVDPLEGLKENVICGHLIPVGTGMKEFRSLIVGSKADLERMEK